MTKGWRVIDCTAMTGKLTYKRGQLVVELDTPVIEITGFLRTGLACRRACRMMAEASYF